MKVYLVVWTGGYDPTSIKMTDDYNLADEVFVDWRIQATDLDTVTFFEYDSNTDTTTVLAESFGGN